MELTTLFGQIDDFWADFEAQYYQHLMADGRIKRVRKSRLSLSEVMTIIIQVQRSAYRTLNIIIKGMSECIFAGPFRNWCPTIDLWKRNPQRLPIWNLIPESVH